MRRTSACCGLAPPRWYEWLRIPRLSLHGRISYIDPQVNPETRTARVRVEVPNTPGEQLRLGMYVDVELAGEAASAVPVVPREAVQTIAQGTVVYEVDPAHEGEFIERPGHRGRVPMAPDRSGEGPLSGRRHCNQGHFLHPGGARAPGAGRADASRLANSCRGARSRFTGCGAQFRNLPSA